MEYFIRLCKHIRECAVNSREKHSALLEWGPLVACIAVVVGPWLIKWLPDEVKTYQWWLQYASDHARLISGFGISGFLLLMFWRSFDLYDELDEETAFHRIEGMWRRLYDKHAGQYEIMNPKLRTIKGSFPTSGHNHETQGVYNEEIGKYTIQVTRERADKSRRAILRGTLEILNKDTLKCVITESDGGDDDVPVGYTETSYFERYKGEPDPTTHVTLTFNQLPKHEPQRSKSAK